MSEREKPVVLTTYMCESCDTWYLAGGTWLDECYCFTCYHSAYGCPNPETCKYEEVHGQE